ncbi:ABC transporter ATP-binding protein [Halogeometricum sp. CBA1124]|uniref:ABC transporter ATP-binding protein n=1 Tax=Halogeometricum sp. CBA1124 TaxID=2668071 RepID=UPI0018D24C7A|nr:ABC transporter ATP-binding protein [Halogeometricum sp. CBA1124]
MASAILSTDGLMKQYGPTVAVEDVSFDVASGEFFSFLGPSGCGKTTTLRMIAGFEEPTEGGIKIGGSDVTTVPPHKRDVAMVFQNYALFPNKTVGGNVGFGLKMEGVPKEERQSRVAEYLELVDLPGFEDRQPANLSGGQQQRVALARALVTEPEILLLDEPLSNLDLKLRKTMRFELKRIQEELNTTFVYVTHDQEEALAMSDRILLMNNGNMTQVGTPSELYNNPANEFAADFIGDTNLVDGEVIASDGHSVDVSLHALGTTVSNVQNSTSVSTGDRVILSVRPEDIDISPDESERSILGTIETSVFYGKVTRFLVDVQGEEMLVEVTGQRTHGLFDDGDRVSLTFDVDDVALLEA